MKKLSVLSASELPVSVRLIIVESDCESFPWEACFPSLSMPVIVVITFPSRLWGSEADP